MRARDPGRDMRGAWGLCWYSKECEWGCACESRKCRACVFSLTNFNRLKKMTVLVFYVCPGRVTHGWCERQSPACGSRCSQPCEHRVCVPASLRYMLSLTGNLGHESCSCLRQRGTKSHPGLPLCQPGIQRARRRNPQVLGSTQGCSTGNAGTTVICTVPI